VRIARSSSEQNGYNSTGHMPVPVLRDPNGNPDRLKRRR
jgi:hypothetical protein